MTQEGFDLLLEWLSPDREKAGLQYESIRKNLIKIFQIRGSVNPEALSDETINRVVSKLPELVPKYEGNPIYFFYNVANKVHLESVSAKRKKEEQLDPIEHKKYFDALQTSPHTENPLMSFLKECLNEMSRESRELIVEYFAPEKAKSDHRRLLAEKTGINLNVMRIKVLRLKKKLEQCISSKHPQPV